MTAKSIVNNQKFYVVHEGDSYSSMSQYLQEVDNETRNVSVISQFIRRFRSEQPTTLSDRKKLHDSIWWIDDKNLDSSGEFSAVSSISKNGGETHDEISFDGTFSQQVSESNDWDTAKLSLNSSYNSVSTTGLVDSDVHGDEILRKCQQLLKEFRSASTTESKLKDISSDDSDDDQSLTTDNEAFDADYATGRDALHVIQSYPEVSLTNSAVMTGDNETIISKAIEPLEEHPDPVVNLETLPFETFLVDSDLTVFPDLLLSPDVSSDLAGTTSQSENRFKVTNDGVVEDRLSFVRCDDPDSFPLDETSASSFYLSSDSDSGGEEEDGGGERSFIDTAFPMQNEQMSKNIANETNDLLVIVDEDLVHPFLGTDAELRRLWSDLCAVREHRLQLQRAAD